MDIRVSAEIAMNRVTRHRRCFKLKYVVTVASLALAGCGAPAVPTVATPTPHATTAAVATDAVRAPVTIEIAAVAGATIFTGTGRAEPESTPTVAASRTPSATATLEVKRMQAMRLTDNVSLLPNKYVTDTKPLIDALRKSNPEAEKILNGLYYLGVAALMDKNPNVVEARVAEVQAQIEAARKAGKPFYVEQKVQEIAGWDKEGRPLFQTASEAAAKLSRIDLALPAIVSGEEELDMQMRLKKGGTGSVDARNQVAIDPKNGQLYVNQLVAPGIVENGIVYGYDGNRGLYLAVSAERLVAAIFLWASSASSVSTAPLVTYPLQADKQGQARLIAWNIAIDPKFQR